MATALDLLMSAKEDVNFLSEESDICTIDDKTRAIFVPSTIVVGGVQSDKNAERIKFSCPKIVGDNLDLSKFSVRINFENVSSVDFNVSIKDQYICDDVAVDGENVTFSWLIGRNAARYMGTVRFIVCAVKTDSDSNISVEWNTTIAEVPVLEGIEIDQPQIGQEEKDVINQLLELTKNTSAEAVQNVNSAKEQAIKDIQSVSQPDTTLTIEGGLAEAKATGEAIGSLKEDINNLQDMKKILDYTSFENGYFNIDGHFSYNSELASEWMGHRKYLSVGNAKQIVFKHSYSSKVQFNIYKFAKDKTRKSLDQIFVEPNVNRYYSIDGSDYFYAISINKDNVSDFTPSNVNPIVSLIEYDCTATKEESIIPNIPEITVSNYATVGTKGTEDYSDIVTAYNGMSGNGYLMVEPMNFDCGNHGFDVQKLYIKGCAKELVKFENNSLLYPYASALIKNECVVENIHFKAGNTVTDKKGAYAIHIEHNNTQGKTMIFRNCIFESEFQSGVGAGLRKDTNLIFENCEFINRFAISDAGNTKKPEDYTTSGALFFHGSIDSANLGTQHITCRNCTFKSDGASALRIEDTPGNLVVATFFNCNFYSKYYGTMNPIDIVGGAEIGYLCGNSVKLGKSSHGNNIPQLNVY